MCVGRKRQDSHLNIRSSQSFLILMLGCMPPAQNSVVMLQMENQKVRATRMATLLTILYCMAFVPVTFHISRSLAATGVTKFDN
jgi:predicted permease